MSERSRQMTVVAVSGTAVTLTPESNKSHLVPPGTGIASVAVTTAESTADASFWGATGTCARFQVIFRRIG